jgi:Ras-related GTP-binding protein A/B
LTARLGATIDVEQNHVRFLGDLILNLWDCGGQDAFMDSYLTTQRSTIFQHVGVMIYVFDIETREMNKDLEYYRDCLEGLRQFSPEAAVFLLVHKMDLVREPKSIMFERKKKELQQASGDVGVTLFGTSIYDESLYKVWRLYML